MNTYIKLLGANLLVASLMISTGFSMEDIPSEENTAKNKKELEKKYQNIRGDIKHAALYSCDFKELKSLLESMNKQEIKNNLGDLKKIFIKAFGGYCIDVVNLKHIFIDELKIFSYEDLKQELVNVIETEYDGNIVCNMVLLAKKLDVDLPQNIKKFCLEKITLELKFEPNIDLISAAHILDMPSNTLMNYIFTFFSKSDSSFTLFSKIKEVKSLGIVISEEFLLPNFTQQINKPTNDLQDFLFYSKKYDIEVPMEVYVKFIKKKILESDISVITCLTNILHYKPQFPLGDLTLCFGQTIMQKILENNIYDAEHWSNIASHFQVPLEQHVVNAVQNFLNQHQQNYQNPQEEISIEKKLKVKNSFEKAISSNKMLEMLLKKYEHDGNFKKDSFQTVVSKMREFLNKRIKDMEAKGENAGFYKNALHGLKVINNEIAGHLITSDYSNYSWANMPKLSVMFCLAYDAMIMNTLKGDNDMILKYVKNARDGKQEPINSLINCGMGVDKVAIYIKGLLTGETKKGNDFPSGCLKSIHSLSKNVPTIIAHFQNIININEDTLMPLITALASIAKGHAPDNRNKLDDEILPGERAACGDGAYYHILDALGKALNDSGGSSFTMPEGMLTNLNCQLQQPVQQQPVAPQQQQTQEVQQQPVAHQEQQQGQQQTQENQQGN